MREVIGWCDPVKENTGFVEATCKKYEALIDERQARKTGGAGILVGLLHLKQAQEADATPTRS